MIPLLGYLVILIKILIDKTMFLSWLPTVSYVDHFEGVAVFESRLFGNGYNSGGIALPGLGIIVGRGTLSADPAVVVHEFGHILQAQLVGFLKFYLFIGLPSLLSAYYAGWGRCHQYYWTEMWANQLSNQYFGSLPWPISRFPSRDISQKTKKRLYKKSLYS